MDNFPFLLLVCPELSESSARLGASVAQGLGTVSKLSLCPGGYAVLSTASAKAEVVLAS